MSELISVRSSEPSTIPPKAERELSIWSTTAPAKWFCAFSWRIAIRSRAGNSASNPFRFIDAPYGHFFADPFLAEQDGRTFLFAEDYQYLVRSASLICIELDESGSILQTRTILRRPYHLSYPQVFRIDGTWYLMPETAAANRVELYRAVAFPWQWKLDRVVMNGVRLFDPTYLVTGDKHWILAGGSSSGTPGDHDELHLFHAASINDRFHPHPHNPVKKDLASARPGGALLIAGDRLVRPAQDCRGWYGRGLTFMAIDRLNDSGYTETPLLRVPDNWVPGRHFGIHTFNVSEHFEVIDVCYHGPQLSAFAGRARSFVLNAIQGNSLPVPTPAATSSPTNWRASRGS